MKRILLDSNIYDLLSGDFEAREKIRDLCEKGHLEVIVTPKLQNELSSSPLNGIPPWFPTSYRKESVAVFGHAYIGHAFLGDGKVYREHCGRSGKVPDAILADSADAFADLFVSEDRRARKRLASSSQRCAVMTFHQFREEVLKIEKGSKW